MAFKRFDLLINKKIPSYNKNINVDADKSISIRSFLIGAISENLSTVNNVLESEDVYSTINSLKKLGIKIKKQRAKKYLIFGKGLGSLRTKKIIKLNFGNSGTLARLLIGILATTSGVKVKISGDHSLNKRSMKSLINLMTKFGASFLPKNKFNLPLKLISSEMPVGINYKAGVSAQLKSAVMLAGLNSFGETKIIETLRSRNHTENMLLNNPKAWIRFEEVSLVLAGLATPLVFSVHSIVSMDFATSVIPGWHTTIFPPYFVAGAIFSGFAMVQTLLLIARKVLSLESYITIKHCEYMNIVIVITGSMVGVAYLSELFISWYSGVEYEGYAFLNRATGPYWWAYWSMMTCNVITPQLFWFKKIRRSLIASFILSIFVNIGMWFERFVIIVTSLHRDFLPSNWGMFHPTFVDIGIFLGTIGIFFTLFLLFSRFFPVLALNELKSILKSSGDNYKKLHHNE